MGTGRRKNVVAMRGSSGARERVALGPGSELHRLGLVKMDVDEERSIGM